MPEVATPLTPERTLPHNLDAEKSVLGAILIQNDAFNAAAEVIDRAISSATRTAASSTRWSSLSERGQPIDFITLKEELARGGELEEVGGPAYITSLADGVPRSTNVEHYARIVKEKSRSPEPDLLRQPDHHARVRGGAGGGPAARPGREGNIRDRRGPDSRRDSCPCATSCRPASRRSSSSSSTRVQSRACRAVSRLSTS